MADAENPDELNRSAGEDAASEPGSEDWRESKELRWAEVSDGEMASYDATVRRMERMIVVAGAICTVAVVWPLGLAFAGGVLAGSVLGWINFRWLARSVNAIGERIVKANSAERGASIVARGIGRILLIAVFAYVIFTCSVRGLVGYLAGLAMPVVAIMCEAVYEFVASARRPS